MIESFIAGALSVLLSIYFHAPIKVPSKPEWESGDSAFWFLLRSAWFWSSMGVIAGNVSLILFSAALIHSPHLRLLTLITLPPCVASSAAWIAKAVYVDAEFEQKYWFWCVLSVSAGFLAVRFALGTA